MNNFILKIRSNNKYFLNILALFSVVISFIYTILLGSFFKLSKNMDLYFASFNFIIYTGYFSQIFYESFIAFYADLKLKNSQLADKLYSTLINQTFLFSLFIVLIINIFSGIISKYYLHTTEGIPLIRAISFYLPLINLYTINKSKLNMNFKFSYSYFFEILVFLSNIIFVFLFKGTFGITSIAYALVLSYFIIVLAQFSYVFLALKTKYFFSFWHENTISIIKGSLFVKAGSLLYGFKDILIPTILLPLGPGVLSSYQFALKFATAVNSVINAPNIAVFSSEINYKIANGEVLDVFKKITRLITNLLAMFLTASVFVYLLIPYILKYLMHADIVASKSIQNIFIYLCLFFIIVTLEAPFFILINALRKFNFVFISNLIYFSLFFSIIHLMTQNLYTLIFTMIFCQFINLSIYFTISSKKIKLMNISKK